MKKTKQAIDNVRIGHRHSIAEHGEGMPGVRVIGESVALELVRAFLAAKYTGEARHQQRLEKVKAIESRHAAKGRAN